MKESNKHQCPAVSRVLVASWVDAHFVQYHLTIAININIQRVQRAICDPLQTTKWKHTVLTTSKQVKIPLVMDSIKSKRITDMKRIKTQAHQPGHDIHTPSKIVLYFIRNGPRKGRRSRAYSSSKLSKNHIILSVALWSPARTGPSQPSLSAHTHTAHAAS